ncbi:hypothetical protein [Micromonospora okii]|uniref:hypothetical protein n=1 Tax=Micromonospora okii TaxID=1182970 RepID=UPI001E53FD49|nr:hypothetical protein [Micromonospora okii]
MRPEFHAEFDRAYHGGHHVGGDSFVVVDGAMSAERRQAVVMHELVHADLVDNSVFGYLQTLVLSLTAVGTRAERANARDLFDTTMAVSLLTQEGLASYRELAYVGAHLGAEEARSYVAGLPAAYREGLDLARRAFGDPVDETYCGYSAPVFHLAAVGLGLAALSGPVLAAYRRPESLIDADALPWIVENGPDHRFRRLCENPEVPRALHEAAWWLGRRGVESTVESVSRAFDLVQELIAEAAPAMPFTSRRVRRAQAARLRPHWNAYFAERNTETSGTVLVPGSADVTFDRALRMAHVLPGGGRTRVALAEPVPMALREFVRTHRRERTSGVRRLVILADRRRLGPATADIDVVAASVPVRTPNPGPHSPVVRSRPTVLTVASLPDFAAVSGELSEAGCIWYSHYSRIEAFRSRDGGLAGPAIAQYPTPWELLEALDSVGAGPVRASYGRHVFGGEELFGVSWDDTFRFTLVSALQAEALFDRLRHRVARVPEGGRRAGGQTVPDRLLARLALLGFTGR